MTRPVHVVRELWSALESDRLEAFLDAADDNIVWQPQLMGGRIFRTTAELRQALDALMASGVRYVPRLEALEDHEGVVVAGGTLLISREGATEELVVHATYHFRDGRLARQSSHATRQDALDSIAAVRVVTSFGAVEEEEGPDGERIVRLQGEIDIASVADLEAVLLRPRPRGQRVVLDLARLRFMDSTGLRILLRARSAALAGRWEVSLRNVPPTIARLFALSGVQELLPLELPD
jgi:anti-anti-sigma factor